jgi:hypothetical protein
MCIITRQCGCNIVYKYPKATYFQSEPGLIFPICPDECQDNIIQKQKTNSMV